MKTLVFMLVLCVASPVYAATHYVRAGAGGLADGTDWTNAYTDVPNVLVRGDTYYIAGGTYAAYTFNDVESGALYVTVKKATVADHGTETGWDPSYGTTQASFPALTINRGYFIWDGQVGSGDDPTSYGFYFHPSNCNQQNTGIAIVTVNSSTPMHYVTVQYNAVVMCGIAYNYQQIGIDPKTSVAAYGAISTNIVVSHNYIYDGNVGFRAINVQTLDVSYNYFGANWSSAAAHGGQLVGNGSTVGQSTDDVTVRYNTFKNSCVFVVDWHKGTNTNWKIYGNIVDGHKPAGECEGQNGLTGIWSTGDSATYDVATGAQVHNNTHIGVRCASSHLIVNPGPLTTPSADHSFAYNNLMVNTINCNYDPATIGTGVSARVVHDYSSYYGHTSDIGAAGNATVETNSHITTGDPFVSLAASDFRLAIATNAGVNLGSPYNIDIRGITRGSDGGWDRGAYEYQSGKLLAPFFLRR